MVGLSRLAYDVLLFQRVGEFEPSATVNPGHDDYRWDAMTGNVVDDALDLVGHVLDQCEPPQKVSATLLVTQRGIALETGEDVGHLGQHISPIPLFVRYFTLAWIEGLFLVLF